MRAHGSKQPDSAVSLLSSNRDPARIAATLRSNAEPLQHFLDRSGTISGLSVYYHALFRDVRARISALTHRGEAVPLQPGSENSRDVACIPYGFRFLLASGPRHTLARSPVSGAAPDPEIVYR